MTRENRINCPACSKSIARLGEHWRQSHPDIDPGEYGIVLGIQDQPPTSDSDPSEAAAVPPEAPVEPVVPAGVADLPPADPPAVPVDYASVLNTFTDVIRELRANNQALQGELLKLKQDQAEFQQSVAGHLNQLPDYVDRALTGRLDQMAAEYQGQAQGGDPRAPAPAPNPAAAMASDPKMALLNNVLPMLAQVLFRPAAPEGGTDFDKMVKLLEGVDKIAEMRQAPYRSGFDDALKLLTTANRMGVPTEKIQSMSELKGGGAPPPAA